MFSCRFTQSMVASFTNDADNRFIVPDPFGVEVFLLHQVWTVSEQNVNLFPFKELVIYNRLLWLGFRHF
jgi:ABC-2 type transport system permease protein